MIKVIEIMLFNREINLSLINGGSWDHASENLFLQETDTYFHVGMFVPLLYKLH